jgi:hypothetical protein
MKLKLYQWAFGGDYGVVGVIAFNANLPRAAALLCHPLGGKTVKRRREETVIRVEWGVLRSFTQLPARLPLVLLAEALTGQLRSQGL